MLLLKEKIQQQKTMECKTLTQKTKDRALTQITLTCSRHDTPEKLLSW